MIRGSGLCRANTGERNGVRAVAYWWFVAWTTLILVAGVPSAAIGQLSRGTNQPGRGADPVGASPVSGQPIPNRVGGTGPHGGSEPQPAGQSLSAPAEYRPAGQPSAPSAVLESVEGQPQPSGWIAPYGSDPGAGIERSAQYGVEWGRPVPGFYHPDRRPSGGLLGLLHPPVGRHHGIGQPLLRESWRFRPYSAGWFMGGVQGSPLIDHWLNQKWGYFAGYRLGWDYDHYWGCEMRFAFGYIELADTQQAKAAQQAADDAAGLAPDDPFRNRFDRRRDSDLFLWDASLLYYPWGDATWRPYMMAGLGATRIDFLDRLSVRRAETVLAMPLAIGLKYRYNDWLALRFECADNIAFGESFNTVHDLSLTGGVEVRFGGTRKAYWPWNPGRHYW